MALGSSAKKGGGEGKRGNGVQKNVNATASKEPLYFILSTNLSLLTTVVTYHGDVHAAI